MKNYSLWITVIIISVNSITAQEFTEEKKNKTTFGVKGGIDQNLFSSSSYGLGLFVGFFAETKLNDKFSLEYGLYMTTRSHNSIQFPLLLKYRINNKLTIFSGPRLDYTFGNYLSKKFTHFNFSVELGLQYKLSKNVFIESAFSVRFLNTNVIDDYYIENKGIVRLGFGYKF